jgi:hypothetical protein
MNSIIYCKNEDQIIDVVNNLTPEFYLSKKESIEKNFILAKNYSNIFDRFRNVLKEFIEINNL